MLEFPTVTLANDLAALKKAAARQPAALTEKQRPRFVLMSYEDYVALKKKAAGPRRSLRFDSMPDDIKDIVLEALDRPHAS
jgi:hypothetical protein